MPLRASVAFLRLRCPDCDSRFVPNPFRLKRELLIVCPHCFSPYVPQRVAALDRDGRVPGARSAMDDARSIRR